MKVPESVSKYMSELGKRGGAVKSAAKTESARRAIKIRWEKAKKIPAST